MKVKAIYQHFLARILIGLGIIVLAVVLMETACNWFLTILHTADHWKEILTTLAISGIVIFLYRILFRTLEERPVDELSSRHFLFNAIPGFFTGLGLQSAFVLIIAIAGTYQIIHWNSTKILITPLCSSWTAGLVAEVLFIGVLFRIVEEKWGSRIALGSFIILFILLHINMPGANALSVCATAFNAGFLLPAAFIYSRSLWLPVFLHFSWDFAEPGLFGGINPSTSLREGLANCQMTGAEYITGGIMGPQSSLQALILCLIAGIVFLILGYRKGHWVSYIPS